MEIAAGRVEIEKAKDTLEDGQDTLEEKEQELLDGEKEYEEGLLEFEEKMAEAEAEKRRSQVTAIYGDRTEEIFPSFVKAISYLIEARIEYLETTYKCIEEDYGDFSHYLTEGLGFSESEQEEMRRLFLE